MTLLINETRYKIDFTFALTVTLMLILCEEDTVIIALFSSVFHEAGHLFFMHLYSQNVRSVTLGAFGVRIDRQLTIALSYKKEAVIALGGILVNFMIASIGAIYYNLCGGEFSLKLSAVNIIIALFNMIPLDTLDIGKVLRYTLLVHIDEAKCDKILSFVSLVFVNLLAVVCLLYSLFIGFNPSLIATAVYLYVITLFKKWS